ncbi:MAG: DUF177 domain-containing protein [Lachnospiraceae bacterium]|nr:DUF177 domain-containing protein [Lachnospiraceae bacterium]
MKLDLFDLINSKGKELNKEIPIEMDEFDSPSGNYPITAKSPLQLYLSNGQGRELSLKSEAHLKAHAPCDRCLTDVEIDVDIDYEIEIPISDGKLVIDEMDAPGCIDGLILDTEQLVYDEILMNWPMKVLCKEDCKGICNKCGCNLNNRTCDCDRTVVDPRMAAIQDVFNKFKEV